MFLKISGETAGCSPLDCGINYQDLSALLTVETRAANVWDLAQSDQ